MSGLRIVLDTHILISSISRKSPFHWVYQKLLEGEFILCVTTDILNEYEELLERFWGAQTAGFVLEAMIHLPNLEKSEVYFRWQLVKKDPDDNKFVDCAVACNANFIVSHDKHFSTLKDIAFPPVKVISADSFKLLLA